MFFLNVLKRIVFGPFFVGPCILIGIHFLIIAGLPYTQNRLSSEKDFLEEVDHRLAISGLFNTKKGNYAVQTITEVKKGNNDSIWSCIVVCRKEDVSFEELSEIDEKSKRKSLFWEAPEMAFSELIEREKLLFIKKEGVRWYLWKGSNSRPFIFLDEENDMVYIVVSQVYSRNPRPYEREGKTDGRYIVR